jgi:alkylation response protein AidB-like acyl-CoA dehydrogenase
VDVRLSPEQQALRDAVARMVDQLGPRTVGDLDDTARSARLTSALRGAGWLELREPTDTGSPLASAVDVAIIAEELGRSAADTPFLGPTLATELCRLAGAPSGVGPQTIALDPGLGTLGSSTSGVAVDAAGARRALIRHGDRLLALPVGGTPLTMDLTRVQLPLAAVATIDDADVVENLGTVGSDAVTAWTAFGLALTCADLVGTMRGALQLARDYAVSRQQFGTSVGTFQAVQHLLADALVLMEGSRSATLYAAWAVDALAAPRALAAAAVAKAFSARAARTVCETAVQVHGGTGNTWECYAHVFLRRALLSAEILGGVGPSLDRVTADLEIGGGDGLR